MKNMHPPAPDSFASDGVVTAGRFNGAIADVSTAQWDGSRGLFSPRRTQRKAWIYGGVMDARFIVGFAIADAGLLGTAFVYVYDRFKQTFIEHKATRPLVFDRHFQPSPQSHWLLKHGRNQWSIQPLQHTSGWAFSFKNASLDLAFELMDDAASISALNNAPSKGDSRPFHYTHKLVGAPANLRCTLNGETHEITNAQGVFDFTLGYPPRTTLWQWACWVGKLDDGRTFACNLVAQTMNGLENTAWLRLNDGSAHVIPMAQAVFHYNRANTLQTWAIHTTDGQLRVQFTPEGQRSESIHIGAMYSHFTQPFGTFYGTWIDEQGNAHALTGVGVVEQHRALW
ncbi:MAG: DUF2804 domain-containing protein [Burkholderiales bacterium]|nr:DUF2804 domain-containing protein [Burkholderiales bacterium]